MGVSKNKEGVIQEGKSTAGRREPKSVQKLFATKRVPNINET